MNKFLRKINQYTQNWGIYLLIHILKNYTYSDTSDHLFKLNTNQSKSKLS